MEVTNAYRIWGYFGARAACSWFALFKKYLVTDITYLQKQELLLQQEQ